VQHNKEPKEDKGRMRIIGKGRRVGRKREGLSGIKDESTKVSVKMDRF